MWTPFQIFYVSWYFSFAPYQEARLNLSEIIEIREKTLIKKIVEQEENKIISNTISLREGI
jgi:hypothetical protein